MTKADIIREIAQSTGIDRDTVLSTVEAFMEVVKDSLEKDQNVYLRGFGSFVIRRRKERAGRDISRNTTIIVPACNVPAFKPSKTFLKDSKE